VVFVESRQGQSTKGRSGNISAVGGEKVAAELVPAGESLLEIEGTIKPKPGSRLLATMQAPVKKPVQVRFTTK